MSIYVTITDRQTDGQIYQNYSSKTLQKVYST
jgi:hypothetical protein